MCLDQSARGVGFNEGLPEPLFFVRKLENRFLFGFAYKVRPEPKISVVAQRTTPESWHVISLWGVDVVLELIDHACSPPAGTAKIFGKMKNTPPQQKLLPPTAASIFQGLTVPHLASRAPRQSGPLTAGIAGVRARCADAGRRCCQRISRHPPEVFGVEATIICVCYRLQREKIRVANLEWG